MKFRVPVALRDRKRYICIQARVPRKELIEIIKRRLRDVSGIKGSGAYRFSLLPVEGSTFVVRTTESAVAALLTVLLIIRYEDIPSLEVGGISGTFRKAKELCAVSQSDG